LNEFHYTAGNKKYTTNAVIRNRIFTQLFAIKEKYKNQIISINPEKPISYYDVRFTITAFLLAPDLLDDLNAIGIVSHIKTQTELLTGKKVLILEFFISPKEREMADEHGGIPL
jgi:hypothetical protein